MGRLQTPAKERWLSPGSLFPAISAPFYRSVSPSTSPLLGGVTAKLMSYSSDSPCSSARRFTKARGRRGCHLLPSPAECESCFFSLLLPLPLQARLIQLPASPLSPAGLRPAPGHLGRTSEPTALSRLSLAHYPATKLQRTAMAFRAEAEAPFASPAPASYLPTSQQQQRKASPKEKVRPATPRRLAPVEPD